MKRFVFQVLALVGAMNVNAQDNAVDSLLSVELQNVQVVSTRASKKTPMAYTNMDKKGVESRELRTGCALSVVADAECHNDLGCRQRHRLYLTPCAWYGSLAYQYHG